MALLKQTQRQYYGGRKSMSFTGDGTTQYFTVDWNADIFPPTHNYTNIKLYFDDVLQLAIDANGISNFTFNYDATYGWKVYFATAPTNGVVIKVEVDSSLWRNPATGINEEVINYQFITIEDIINNFMVVYTGEDKILSKVKRTDVQFHAMRALQELSYDTLKSVKSQEIEIPPSLTMIIPQDYVNYVKLTWSDSSGIEHVIYPASKTSNPRAIKQDTDGNYSFDIDEDATTIGTIDQDDTSDLINPPDSDTWGKYKSATPSENNNYDYQNTAYWSAGGERYGLDPQYAQVNGSFFIDEIKGLIHFSSNISGKTIILKYISDGLGTDGEMIVHKFAEEAMYKWIVYAIVSTRVNIQEYIVQRLRKERFAETRKAKLRLSNLKLEELSQVLKGKAKQIKH